jgi:hypothetical protein
MFLRIGRRGIIFVELPELGIRIHSTHGCAAFAATPVSKPLPVSQLARRRYVLGKSIGALSDEQVKVSLIRTGFAHKQVTRVSVDVAQANVQDGNALHIQSVEARGAHVLRGAEL